LTGASGGLAALSLTLWAGPRHRILARRISRFKAAPDFQFWKSRDKAQGSLPPQLLLPERKRERDKVSGRL
jgi:hypothetical protein